MKMGPPVTSRCLLCRSGVLSVRKGNCNLKSCATSLCAIFGLADNHPFKTLYEKAQYCEECLKDVLEADVSLAKLELLKQSLLRFQSRVYNKLGDNYFQINDRESINASCEDFESGGDNLRGKKFKYDEIIKIVYEKLDKECPRWERFSSEGNSSVEIKTSTSAVSVSVQTDPETCDIIVWQNHQAPSNSMLPDGDASSAWNNDDDDPGGADTESHNDPLDTSSMISVSNSTTTNNVDTNAAQSNQILITTINFDQKVYCTYDPENCKKFFYDDYNLEIHIKSIHLGNPKPYECSECRKSFVDEARLKSHCLRVHTPFGPFICEHCGKGFGSQGLLRDHNRKIHEKEEVFNCYFCSAPFTCKDTLLLHENQHRSNANPFECLFCSEKLPNSSVLKAHYANVHAEGKFRCKLCDKPLANENGLRLHMITHTGIYKCGLCSFTGSSQSALNTHMSSHSTDKPYTCEMCGQAYKYAKNLVAHRRIHTGEKPYVCKICNQSFRERAYLKRHEESHSTDEHYECTICTKRFKVKENLRKHIKIHNGNVKKKSPKVSKPRKSGSKMTSVEGDEGVKKPKKSGKKNRDKSNKKASKIKKKAKKDKKRNKNEETSPVDLKSETETVDTTQTQKVEFTYAIERSEELTQLEIDNAIASIQQHQVVVTSSDGIPQSVAYTNATVYSTTDFQPTTINVPNLGPVTVLTTDARVIRNTNPDQPIQYEFGYNLG